MTYSELQEAQRKVLDSYTGDWKLPDPVRTDNETGVMVKFEYDWAKISQKMGL